MRNASMFFFTIITALTSYGQNFGEIKGKIVDAISGEPVEYANVWVETGTVPMGTTTDSNGSFSIKPLSPGTYDLHVKDIRFMEYMQTNVQVTTNEITILGNIEMGENILGTITIVDYVIPLISPDNPSKMTIGSADLVKRADVRNTRAMISSLVPGVTMNSEGDQLYFRGARPQNIATFIDGVKIGGGEIPRVPSNSIKNLTVYTGGIPASYGDMTGGVIVIETKGYMDFYRESQREKMKKN